MFVNDGSPDDSLGRGACGSASATRACAIVDLSRNFGHHKALMTGLRPRARRAGVPASTAISRKTPSGCSAFHERADARRGADVVYGVQTARKGGLFERVDAVRCSSRVFNRMLTDPIPRNVVTARLMTRRYVRALVAAPGPRALPGRAVGHHRVRPAAARRSTRAAGRASSYSLRTRVSVLVNALTSFSNRPLIYIFYLGGGVMLLSPAGGGVCWSIRALVTAASACRAGRR